MILANINQGLRFEPERLIREGPSYNQFDRVQYLNLSPSNLGFTDSFSLLGNGMAICKPPSPHKENTYLEFLSNTMSETMQSTEWFGRIQISLRLMERREFGLEADSLQANKDSSIPALGRHGSQRNYAGKKG